MRSVSFHLKGSAPKATKEQALKVAKQLGCRGAHQHDDGSWLPCRSMREFEAIKKGKSEYIRTISEQNFESKSLIERRVQRAESKSANYYSDRRMAEQASRRNGCSGVRTIVLGGEHYYAPCVSTDKFEELGERGVVGIANVDGGGLVSAPVGSKADIVDIDSKGFVNFVSRSTDPDVFSDPESARIRSRNLGCIGIRRYTARDGKTVWLPCSNTSDYNRSMNIRGDNSPRNFRRGQPRRNARKSLPTTLSQEKEARKPKRLPPALDSDTVNKLAMLVRKHNANAKKDIHKTNLRDIRIVYLRGLASGSEDDAERRVATFLSAMSSDTPLPKGKRMDFDLVPATHPSKDDSDDKPKARKSAEFDDGQVGLVNNGSCCPPVVKRYHRL